MKREKLSSYASGIYSCSVCLLLALFSLGEGLCLSGTSGKAQFERIGPYGGTVRSLLISSKDSGEAYLGTNDGQLFKSRDGGVSWALLYPGIEHRQFVIGSFVEDPANEDHLYVGGWDLRSDGGGLFESKDAGQTWTRVMLPGSNAAVRGFAISKEHPDRMIAGTATGIFVSSDGGKTWQKRGERISAFQQTESVAINPKNPNLLFVGTWHLGYRSKDFGMTWELTSQGMITDSDLFSIRIDEHSPNSVFAAACTGLYHSTDGGASWMRLKVLRNSYLVRAQVVAIDPNRSERVYAGTTEGIFASRDSGKTWDRVTSNDLTINAIQIDPADSNVILAGTELHGVLISRDGGKTWAESNKGFVNRSIVRILTDPTNPDRILVGEPFEGKNGGFYIHDSLSRDWLKLSPRDVPGVGMLSLLVLPGNLGRIAGTAQGVFLQKDLSGDWTALPGPISSLAVNDLAIDSKKEWIFAGTEDGVYRARISELRFEKPPRYNFIPRVFSLLASKTDSSLLLAGTHFGVLRSSDSGATWQFSSRGMPDHTIVECLVNSPGNENHLFAGTSTGLYESQDSGNIWERVLDGLLNASISSIVFLDSTGKQILVADNTFGGVLLSEDAGKRWEKIEDPEFSSPVRTLMQDSSHPSIIYVGTGAEGVYRLSLKAAQPKKQIEVNETDGRRRTKSQNDTTSRESTLMISTAILSGRLQD